MSPQRKAGTIFLRDGVFCSQGITGFVFKQDFGSLVFKRNDGSGFSFGLWTLGWFNTGIRFGFSDVGLVLHFGLWTLDWFFFGLWTWFFYRILDILIRLFDYVNIEILSALNSFCIFLFAQLPGNLICTQEYTLTPTRLL